MKALIVLWILFIAAPCDWGQSTSAETPAATTATPSEVINKGQRIFACYHSFFDGVLPVLVEVAKYGGIFDQVIVGTNKIGGSKAIQHWNVPDASNQAKRVLIAGKADVLILTPVYLPDAGIEKFAQLGLEHNPNIRVTVMELWMPFDVYNPSNYDKNAQPIAGEPPWMPRPRKVDHNAATVEGLRKMHEYYFRTMDEKIAALDKQFGKQVVLVVPMGQAVLTLRKMVIEGKAPGLKTQEDLFRDQLGHPTAPMLALEAYCYYAVIYRKNPIGLPAPTVLMDAGIPAEDISLLNQLLQYLAWDAVIHHPLSGVRANG